MIKKILCILAAFAGVVLSLLVLFVAYNFFVIWTLKCGIESILSPKCAVSYLSLNEAVPAMNIFWVDKKLGKVAVFLDYPSKRENLAMLPMLKARKDFILSAHSEKFILSKPNTMAPYFIAGFNPDDGILCEVAYVVFDAPVENIDSFYKAIENKEITNGSFDGSALHYKNFNSEIDFAGARPFWGDLFLNLYFHFNLPESARMLEHFSLVWGRYKPKTASFITRDWSFKYYDSIFESNESVRN